MNARASISIVTAGPLCRNPRALKEAQALGNAGYAVSVFTVANRPEYERVDAELLVNAPFRKIALNNAPGPRGAIFSSFANRSTTLLARRMARYGLEWAQALGPVRSFARLAASRPADLTIVHTEIGFAVGRILAGAGRRIAADFEDWHSEDLLPAARRSRPQRLLRQLEHLMLHRTAFATTTSAALADSLHEAYGGERAVVIHNTFPLQPAAAPVRHDAVPSFFWFSQTIGPGRGLEPFLSSWAATHQKSRLVLLGECAPGFRQQLLERVPADRRSQVEFLRLVSPGELPNVIARHSVGLALELPTPRSRDLTITNKAFQYLNAGLAIVATRTTGQTELMRRIPAAGIIVATDDATRLAAELDDLLAHPARLAEMRAAARHAAEETFCWERDEPTLLRTVAAAIPHDLSPATSLP